MFKVAPSLFNVAVSHVNLMFLDWCTASTLLAHRWGFSVVGGVGCVWFVHREVLACLAHIGGHIVDVCVC